MAVFSDSWAASSPADELLRIEQRLVRDGEGESVWVELVEPLRAPVLGWARPKSYAGER